MNRASWIMFTTLIASTIIVPAGITAILPKSSTPPPVSAQTEIATDGITIKVYRTQEKKVVDMPLEQYVKGVVAAEMPVNFPLEALKAQAIAARTNAVRRIVKNSLTPEGAHLTDDFRSFQAYSDDTMLQKRWGEADYKKNMAKIVQAVNETKGQIITYQGQPIEALFFSTSNGKTESAEAYWGNSIPYLQSIACPWDQNAPKATYTQTISLKDLANKLQLKAVPVAASASSPNWLRILSKSSSDRITELTIAGQTFTGQKFRELLGLPSNDFTWKIEGNNIVITTRGFGHGVGMSQYGAKGLAEQGKTAADIIKTFYQGVDIQTYKPPTTTK